MKILYLGCHSVLECDELSLFWEMDDVQTFSLHGAYMNPQKSGDDMRPPIKNSVFYPQLYSTALQCDKNNIHDELIQWCDIVLFMHNSKVPGEKGEQPWLENNWDKIQHYGKKTIWRSIGQSVPSIERVLKIYRQRGLKIVRYSPAEADIPDYAGSDAVIRFGKSSDEFKGYTGENERIMMTAQSFQQRAEHLRYSIFEKVSGDLPFIVYGRENEGLGERNGGNVSYDELKSEFRKSRVYFYTGTQPAQYTLGFIEALMTGMPIVAIGNQLRGRTLFPFNTYEVDRIIQNGRNGYVLDDLQEIRDTLRMLLSNKALAHEIGARGRQTAIELFDNNKIKVQWYEFLKSI